MTRSIDIVNQDGTHTVINDLVSNIMLFEEGCMDDDQTVVFFQGLIDSGMAWTLQGSYGRMAARLIEEGLCHENH
jgi:hypothetical protein